MAALRFRGAAKLFWEFSYIRIVHLIFENGANESQYSRDGIIFGQKRGCPLWTTSCVVRPTRLELVWSYPHAPQTCASASSATAAYTALKQAL